ncbi:transmembrane ascorbate-dependent reductase CYB561-like isoform X1 [Ylistrum balloti]|uniref:transmembrane ascorbate-dependent reductase CYB561-like isoform X1 n=2 Tax=Ylistrum balloti TaxID=509963 RepID=UPI002905ACBF|nr:transmembrane ascorbate-dependent reductase CYB561-like isoform X1 [Ylistrum balloti]
MTEPNPETADIYQNVLRTGPAMENYDKHDAPTGGNLGSFTGLVLLVQGLGLAAVILVAVWMGHFRDGFAWTSDPAKEFNYHPVFMVIGLIFLYSDAILAYRVFRNVKKMYIKVMHGMIHLGALIFASVGLKAVFDSHNLLANPIPNLYSLHSWLGLITVILFGLQWVIGFLTFLAPGLSQGVRARYMPHHVFWGVGILCMAAATALMGITEKAIFLKDKIQYSKLPTEGIVLNTLGIVIVALVALVAFVVTRPEYKRQPSPEEDHIQLMG